MSKPSIVWGEKGEVSHRQSARKLFTTRRRKTATLPVALLTTGSLYLRSVVAVAPDESAYARRNLLTEVEKASLRARRQEVF